MDQCGYKARSLQKIKRHWLPQFDWTSLEMVTPDIINEWSHGHNNTWSIRTDYPTPREYLPLFVHFKHSPEWTCIKARNMKKEDPAVSFVLSESTPPERVFFRAVFNYIQDMDMIAGEISLVKKPLRNCWTSEILIPFAIDGGCYDYIKNDKRILPCVDRLRRARQLTRGHEERMGFEMSCLTDGRLIFWEITSNDMFKNYDSYVYLTKRE